MRKDDHSPLDSAVFALLNSAVFGLVFSLSMFNKNYESSNFNFRKKLGFTGRNIVVISSLHGLNQYLIKLFKRKNSHRFFRNSLKIKNELLINLIGSFLSTSLPAYLACKLYYYKNEYILIEKKFFFGIGVIFFLFDYFNTGNSIQDSRIKLEIINKNFNMI
jgi:hypothetical protein